MVRALGQRQLRVTEQGLAYRVRIEVIRVLVGDQHGAKQLDEHPLPVSGAAVNSRQG